MIMNKKLRDWNAVAINEDKNKKGRRCAELWRPYKHGKKPPETVYSTRRTDLITRKKISVLHKEKQSSDRTLQCNIADDGINGKSMHEPVEPHNSSKLCKIRFRYVDGVIISEMWYHEQVLIIENLLINY